MEQVSGFVSSQKIMLLLVLAPRVRKRRMHYAPSLLDYYQQDDDFQGSASDAALRYLIGSTVIVNLARRPALMSRLQNLLQRTPPLNRMSRISRFEAVDGKSLDLHNLVRSGTLSQEAMDSAMRTGVRVEAINMTIGAIGCALSHIRLWQQIAADHGRGATLVLEDDVYFAFDFEERLREAVALLPANFSMVYLSLPEYAKRTAPIAAAGSATANGSQAHHGTTTVSAVLGDKWTSAYITVPRY